MPPLMCLSCARELATQDVHQISDHGPFCWSCAQSAKGIPFAQWLDEQWQR
jgi:hypothetical protein